MNLQLVKNAVTSTTARQILLARKNSPAVMFGAGIVGVVGTVVLACNATLKLEEVVDDAEAMREKIRTVEHPNYSDHDRKKDEALLRIKTAVAVGKLYAPALGVGVLSVGLLTGSHVTLNRRNAGLTAAYAALNRGFDEYRARVREELGEEKELELRRNVKSVEIHDTKKGEVHHNKVMRAEGLSMYARLWDETTSNVWQKEPEYNMVYLRSQQNYANDRLRARGHVMLNDVYDLLGLERTKAGCVVGWVWDNPKNPKANNFIDFGIFRDDNMWQIHQFMVGEEGALWLDFNVDGVVYDLIGRGNG